MPEPVRQSRRSCYINFAEHLLNAFNPNMFYPRLPHRWADADWFAFIDMIADFGFTTFEFWLVPRLFCRNGLNTYYGRRFAEQMRRVIEHGQTRGVGIKMIAALSTVGDDWHTHCPKVREEWEECLWLWDRWTRRLPGLAVVGIFPGDPGGCSRNGCTSRTFIDGALEVAGIVQRNLPEAEIELGTWGNPFFGWGNIQGPPGWRGEFIQGIQHSAWRFDKARADAAMAYLLRRLPDFPADTSVAINLGFNPDGNPDGAADGSQDARPWVREIARSHRVLTWDFSLTEGENAILPHYRFDRLFARRRQEREAAPYSGGICFTMTPRLNQLSLFESAQSFLDPDADPAALCRRFYARLFGAAAAERLTALLPLFEIVPDWGNYARIELDGPAFHRCMCEGRDLLRDLAGRVAGDVPLHPEPEQYREHLEFFFGLLAELSGPAPDYAACRVRYWQRVYAIYDRLPQHVDPRPQAATDRLVSFFRTRFGGG